MAKTLDERLAEAKARRAAAEAKLTPELLAEIEKREEMEREEAAARKAETRERDEKLAKRMDAARDKLGPKAKIASLVIDGYDDTFIVVHSAKAHEKWDRDITDAATNKKLDKLDVNRAYAVASIYAWNDVADFGPDSPNGFELIQHLKAHPGMVTPIVNKAARLAGLFAEERKSSD